MSLRGVSASYYAARGPPRGGGEIINMIDAATSGSNAPDEVYFTRIAEKVKPVLDPKVLNELVRRMRKKLKAPDHTTVMNSLLLMEFLMRELHGHTDFQLAMGSRKLMNQMYKVIKAAKPGDVNKGVQKQKCLELIARWAATFGSQRAIGRVFADTAEMLRKKNYRLPDAAPRSEEPAIAVRQQLSSVSGAQQLEVVANVTSMLRELILASDSTEAVRTDEVVQQLLGQCRGFQNEIASLLSNSSKEEDLANLLELNEKVLMAINLYESAASGSTQIGRDAEGATTAAARGSRNEPLTRSFDSFQGSVDSDSSGDSLADFVQPASAKGPGSPSPTSARSPALSIDLLGGADSPGDAAHSIFDEIPFDDGAQHEQRRPASAKAASSSSSFGPSYTSIPSSWTAVPAPKPADPFQGPVAPGWGQTPPPQPQYAQPAHHYHQYAQQQQQQQQQPLGHPAQHQNMHHVRHSSQPLPAQHVQHVQQQVQQHLHQQHQQAWPSQQRPASGGFPAMAPMAAALPPQTNVQPPQHQHQPPPAQQQQQQHQQQQQQQQHQQQPGKQDSNPFDTIVM